MRDTVYEDEGSAPLNGSLSFSEHPVACVCLACSGTDPFKDDVARSGEPTGGAASGAAAVATLQEMSDFLVEGYWNNGTGLRHNLGSTGLDPNDGVLYYTVTGFPELTYGGGSDLDGVSAERAALIHDAFDVYEEVLGIDFVAVDYEEGVYDDSVIDILFSDNKSGAYAGSTRYTSDGTIYYSYVNLAESWSGGTSTYNDYTLQTIFHEIGHALGLGHQGPYNGSASYSTNAIYELDSWQATMMSYFWQTQNTAIDASYELLQTPMAVDWIALNDIYGQFDGFGTENAFNGNTVYGFNTNISAETSMIWHRFETYADFTASTIIDAGGTDTLDFSGYGADQKIDLTVQTADQTYQDSSDIGGSIGNLTLAIGTVIENAIGGSGNDTLIGNDADNVLVGNGGADTFNGRGGNDTFDGGTGVDTAIFNLVFGSYTFSVLQTAIEVIGEGVDLVYDTIENFQFADLSYTYADIASMAANAIPVAADDGATVAEGEALTLAVLANDGDDDGDALTVTQIDGQDIEVGATVALASGASVRLNIDQTLTYTQNGAFDTLAAGQTGADAFSYTVSDGRGGTDTAQVDIAVAGADSVTQAAIGQAGTVTVAQTSPDQWHSVSFDAPIADAVVVMGPLGFNEADPATTRVRNVTETGFEFQIDEWTYLDGIHAAETIGWLAIAEGTHTLASGQTIVAGTQTAGTTFSDVAFGTTLTDAVVLAEVASVNEADPVITRLHDVTGTGFSVALNEEQAGGPHLDETVGWIALETGTGSGLDVQRTLDTVTSNGESFVFNDDFGTPPVLLANMQTTNGADTATARMAALDSTSVTLFAEEEQSADSETFHTAETFGFAAMLEGMIYEDSFLV